MGDLLKGPIAGVIEGINGILGKFIADPNEKLKASQELLKIQLEFQSKVLEADMTLAKAQASVITAEASSGNWLAASWRPILMLVFTYIIFHNYVLATMFHLTTVEIPPDMWALLKLGIGGYVVGRSVEKTAANVAEVMKSK